MRQRTPISYNVHPLVHYANVVIKCSKYPNNISEKYIMSPNYPNDYPNNYDEVLTPIFLSHDVLLTLKQCVRFSVIVSRIPKKLRAEIAHSGLQCIIVFYSDLGIAVDQWRSHNSQI